ncbi:MAG: hypothetical protein HY074_04720, partial [Deltaproteobacteria bacterium]|nr:hypothetical protein [Deltaproteobacteria bacterium]
MPRTRIGRYICLAWLLLAIYFAWSRSIWGDEMVRLDQQKMGLAGSLHALFSEPSPFSPGESILIWLSGTVLGPVLPVEIWGRLPSLAWGFGAMWLASSLEEELAYLQWLLFFS